jgi:hypothetical protein
VRWGEGERDGDVGVVSMSFLELLFFNIIRCGDGINNRVFNTMCPKNIVDEIKKLKL